VRCATLDWGRMKAEEQEKLEAYLASRSVADPPFSIELITGGRSNITYSLTDSSGRKLVLRRPPLAEVLETAHDMRREWRVISALFPTEVPVPRPVHYCDDPGVIGAPFYLMEYVEGAVLRDAESVRRHLPSLDARRRAGMELIGVLSRLHAIDPDEVGLGDLGKREGYLDRQIRRWWTQFQATHMPGDDTIGIVGAVQEKLARSLPTQQRCSIVHGDYRLDNAVVGEDGSIRAVLDWEICTLGDPLADVGLLMVYWAEPGDPNPLLALAATSQPGFPTRAELLEEYERLSGLDLHLLGYYVAFGYWKLACILQGVYHRYRKGAHPDQDESWRGFIGQVRALGEQALAKLEELGL
jgi:aminoglycoside phosphotransferase (APT) family kinase protein